MASTSRRQSPERLSEFVAPGQEEVDRDLSALQTRIEKLIEEYERKVEKRAEIGKPLRASKSLFGKEQS